MLRRHVTTIVVLALCGGFGCGPGAAPPAADSGLRVAVSLPPQAWLVERLAGERARVEVILPPAATPETWTPTPAAMLAIGEAELYFAVGHPSLAFESRLLTQAAKEGASTIDFGQTDAADNPHRWLDLDAVRRTAESLADRLTELDPGGAALFAHNARALHAEIDALESRLGEQLSDRRRSVVVVQHPAWGSLLGRFGVEELAIERDGKEPDPVALIAMVERARREGVEVIFTQREVSPRSARLIAADIGARIEVLDPLAREWPVALERAVTAFAEALR